LDGTNILWFRPRFEFGKSYGPAVHSKVLVDLTGFTGSDRFVGRPETKLGPTACELNLNAEMLRSVLFAFAGANALKYGIFPVADIAAGKSRPSRRFGQHLVITFWHHLCADMSRYEPFDFTARALSARRNGIKSKHVGTGGTILVKNYGTVGWRFEPVRVHKYLILRHLYKA
jgi:hypothetical protein